MHWEMNHELAHIARFRLQNQHITHPSLLTIGKIAAWMGATQAQDYTHAKWALGLRLPGTKDADVEAAIDRGEIIRTHLLRPTWHFVAAEDLRWMLALSAPQINAIMASTNRLMGLDEAIFARCNDIIAKTLEDGQHLTREELMSELEKAGIATNDFRAAHIMMRAEQEGIVCNGSRRGKQFTYALIDERIPASNIYSRPDAIAELARRYFRSHAPATLHDFQWWSGLKMTDARKGLEAVQPTLVQETIDKQTYWMPHDFQERKTDAPTLHLLPAFDEYLVSYKDRSASLHSSRKEHTITKNGIFKPVVVQNAWVHGIWQRSFKKDKVAVDYVFFEEAGEVDAALLEEAVQRFSGFYSY
ncbi:MAG: AlkZ family DNA glycosylase [Lewinellaceae bacterium]|nr:AlkZ family DNA glycosylase [Lewinellaceae bacterium]